MKTQSSSLLRSRVSLTSAHPPLSAVTAVASTAHIAPLSLVVLPSRSLSRAATPARATLLDRHLSPPGRSPGARTLPLANPDGKNVCETHDAGTNGIADDGPLARSHEARPLRESEAETAVDDAENNGNAAEPDVAVGPNGAGVVALEEDVVQEAEDGLESEQGEQDDADDGVSVVERVEVARHPDANAEGRDV